jgi:hypothetical protein
MGSSDASDIFVQVADGSRISVFHKGLLSGKVKVSVWYSPVLILF